MTISENLLPAGLQGDKIHQRNYPDATNDSLLAPTTYLTPEQVTMYILSHFFNDLPHMPHMRQLSDLWKINVALPNLSAAQSGYEFKNHYGRWEKPPFPGGDNIVPSKPEIIDYDLELSKLIPPLVGHWHGHWPPIQSGYEDGPSKPKSLDVTPVGDSHVKSLIPKK